MHTMQNLWPEFDNEQLQAEYARNTQKPSASRRRRPTERVVISTLREWFLHEYIVPYCRSLAATRIFPQCYWIDGLGSSHILQSVFSTSHELTKENRSIVLHYIALESPSSKPKVAMSEETVTLPKDSGSIRTSWPDAAPSLLQSIDQSAAIFLLNPFAGSIPFFFEALSPLYQRTAPTEICLLISYKQVEIRLIPFLRTPNGASAFTSLIRSDRWKSLLTNNSEMKYVVDGLTGAFLDSIQQQHFLTAQRIPLLMHIAPANVETIPYALIFATRRQDSLLCMNDAICVYHRRIHEQSLEGVLTEAWFATQQREHLAGEMQQLYQSILQQGRARRQRRWPDLRQQALLTNFGQFTQHDFDSVIQKLLQSGEVRCEWRQKPIENPQSEEQRIPGNEDILLW
ncbi:MAG TPA: hypothetical protein VEH81_08910 [Ktedonobacteraceae bacterium]|nr:hypothetical protein [Ktedonobacteraceae bacterium]